MNTHDTLTTKANVRIEQYDIDAVRRLVPAWDRWPRDLRRTYLRVATEPVHVGRISNVTCVGLHEYIATAMSLDEGDAHRLDPPSELAWGDDDSQFSTDDTALNNEVGERTPITDPSSDADEFNIDEYLSSNEQNGNTLRELGIFSDDGKLWNHSPTDQVYEKDSTFALSVNVAIPVGDAG